VYYSKKKEGSQLDFASFPSLASADDIQCYLVICQGGFPGKKFFFLLSEKGVIKSIFILL
jgi:hypothetical protein